MKLLLYLLFFGGLALFAVSLLADAHLIWVKHPEATGRWLLLNYPARYLLSLSGVWVSMVMMFLAGEAYRNRKGE